MPELHCWCNGRQHTWSESCPPKAVLPPIAITISQHEQDHQAAMRAASYELAVQRGHMRRG